MAKRKETLPADVPKRKSGAQKIEIDLEQLRTFCRLKPSTEDCAAFFKCSIDTIERRVFEGTGLTFKDFREQAMVHTKFDLIRRAIEKAKKGDNDMMKFCLKNLSDWSDRPDNAVEVSVTNNVGIKVQQIDLEERIALLKGK